MSTLATAVFVPPTIEWSYLVPVLVVLGAGVVGVLVEAFVPDRVRRTVQVVLALAATAAATATVAWLWVDIEANGGSAQVLGGSLVLDRFGLAMQGVVALLALLAVLVIADRTSTGQDAFAPAAGAVPGSRYEDQARAAGLQQTEVYPLVLFAVGGMMIFPATSDLLVMFVALEVLSLPLYVLCATARRRRLLSQEAAFKYFLLGAFASALFLFGIALLYGFAGSVKLGEIAQAIAGGSSPFAGMELLVVAGLLLVLVGLLFKIGAAPFHAWTPDVYQGAPTPITGFMAACTKVAAVGALVRVVFVVGGSLPAAQRHDMVVALWVVAILTMVVGTVVGAVQTDMKRLLAYSSIAHAGFILVGIVGLQPTTLRAVVFYVLVYGLATVGAFAVVTLVRERSVVAAPVAVPAGADANLLGATDGPEQGVVLGEATHLSQWAGLGRRSPWLAGSFALFLLSMAGIPLTAGFVAKFGVFQAAIAGGAWPLAVIGVLASAVAVFFYVRVIVLMFFTAPAEQGEDDAAASGTGPRTVVTVVRSAGPATVAIAVCAAGVVLLGLFPSPVLGLFS